MSKDNNRYMTDGEIVTFYRQAKSPKKQITILAQLNCMKKQEIKDILIKAGCNLNKPPAKNITNSVAIRRINWEAIDPEIIRLYKEGKKYREIAEITGVGIKSIGVRVHRLRDKGYIPSELRIRRAYTK